MRYFCLSSSENLFIDMADRLSEDGWRELGYVYVNIDDCWSSMKRDEKGRLQPDPKRWVIQLQGIVFGKCDGLMASH